MRGQNMSFYIYSDSDSMSRFQMVRAPDVSVLHSAIDPLIKSRLDVTCFGDLRDLSPGRR